MTDVWTGDIKLPDGARIRNVGFSTHHCALASSLPEGPLHFLSTVDTACIPLYLAAGPSLDVWTTDETTEEWFASLLLATCTNDAPDTWWTLARAQSPVGILVQVEQIEKEAQPNASLTEILIYGTSESQTGTGSPPPLTSSSERVGNPLNLLPTLRVHALPLSSQSLYRHRTTYEDPVSSALSNFESLNEPEFLPPRYKIVPTLRSPKRKRDAFEEANIARRKPKGEGGLGISAAAARATSNHRLSGARMSLPCDFQTTSTTRSRHLSVNAASVQPSLRSSSHSRSTSLDKQSPAVGNFAQIQFQPSELSRVSTILPQPKELSSESRNKEALSKVVMAAMRMHGLQQSKKPRLRQTSTATVQTDILQSPGVGAAEYDAKDTEYKLIYHQTFKSVALAFRKHMATEPLHSRQDQLRQVVEKFLTLFLTDPLVPLDQTSGNINPTGTPGARNIGMTGKDAASPFDLPSVRRPGLEGAKTDTVVYTGSPVNKRVLQTEQTGQMETASTKWDSDRQESL